MQPTPDPDLFKHDPPSNRAQRRAAAADARHLPDIHTRPRRRWLTPAIASAATFVLATGLFYGLEAFLPKEYKPSHFIGGYQEEIALAVKSGELAAQIQYDTQLRGVEVQYQTQLKRIETSAIMWQEQCRAGLQNVNNLYQAIYNRANIFVQATADLQKAYASARQQIVAGTLGGETTIITMATTFLPFIAMIDPVAARQLTKYVEDVRRQALRTFDREARGGITMSVRGWDAGLPRPDALPPMIRCDMPPIGMVSGTPVPITVPAVATPRR